MTDVLSVLQETKNEWLLGTYRTHLSQLASSMTDSATSLTLTTTPKAVGEGSIIAIDDELAYVVEANEGPKTMDVIRGIRGSVAAAHDSGAIVEINPRYPHFTMKSALKSEIRSWPPSIYIPTVGSVSVTDDQWSIDVAAAFPSDQIVRIIGLTRLDQADSTRRISRRWTEVWDEDEIVELQLPSNGYDGTHRLTVGKKPVIPEPLTDETDLEDDLGLSAGLIEVIKLGVAWRLLTGRESVRLLTEARGQSRLPDEVPVQATSTFGRQLKVMRDERLAEESARLVLQYGLKETV